MTHSLNQPGSFLMTPSQRLLSEMYVFHADRCVEHKVTDLNGVTSRSVVAASQHPGTKQSITTAYPRRTEEVK